MKEMEESKGMRELKVGLSTVRGYKEELERIQPITANILLLNWPEWLILFHYNTNTSFWSLCMPPMPTPPLCVVLSCSIHFSGLLSILLSDKVTYFQILFPYTALAIRFPSFLSLTQQGAIMACKGLWLSSTSAIPL